MMKSTESFKYFTVKGELSDALITSILDINNAVFGAYQLEAFVEKVTAANNLFCAFAENEGVLIGFKIGYELSDGVFYSWVGGVRESYRQMGIAKKLQEMQEEYLVAHDYKILRTKSTNNFKPMVIFNLKNGFDIVGVENSEHGLKIMFEKELP
ncbi:GNAT family N-acetyltransferase [Joostella atrarenae]|uniref:GNAT family N-acetyltransferase n=1 Tax=Joostella atrarenae TaxID=679257 RepID=A0ABS9J003_9FLAO|nr:GNAT family N-acetyltransferase [Joostella atrarenae]MCF8713749.1 GNAT family N-acetyltransferase [Joostella atrarenae]